MGSSHCTYCERCHAAHAVAQIIRVDSRYDSSRAEAGFFIRMELYLKKLEPAVPKMIEYQSSLEELEELEEPVI